MRYEVHVKHEGLLATYGMIEIARHAAKQFQGDGYIIDKQTGKRVR